MTQKQIKRILILALPYVIMGLVATNIGEAWRLATGSTSGEKIMSLMYTIPQAFGNPLPSFNPFDLLVGLCCGGGLKLAVYLRGKNAKKYRHNQEFGSARWGNAKDIERFVNPKFQENVILTQTERLTMESRAKNPTDSRNKNVLVVGGSGSGKTRFFVLPNLLQCHSSYVVTDPKSSLLGQCGHVLEKQGYQIRFGDSSFRIKPKLAKHFLPPAKPITGRSRCTWEVIAVFRWSFLLIVSGRNLT